MALPSGDLIVYVGNSIESVKELLELINEFRKVEVNEIKAKLNCVSKY